MHGLLHILDEDDQLLVVNKPADLVCHPTKGDVYSSLISRVRLHLGEGVPPHLINRLDRETSGVVLVGKTLACATALRRIWESRGVHKEYYAVVHGHVGGEQGVIDAPLGPDPASAVAIKDAVRPDGAPAQTGFAVIRRFTRAEGSFTALRVFPRSGRKHQIRIHLAHLGHPIVGDKIYGGDEQLYLDFVAGRLTSAQSARLLLSSHALHAVRVSYEWEGRQVEHVAPPEARLAAFVPEGWGSAGGGGAVR